MNSIREFNRIFINIIRRIIKDQNIYKHAIELIQINPVIFMNEFNRVSEYISGIEEIKHPDDIDIEKIYALYEPVLKSDPAYTDREKVFIDVKTLTFKQKKELLLALLNLDRIYISSCSAR